MAGRVTVDTRGSIGFLVFDHTERRNAITPTCGGRFRPRPSSSTPTRQVRVVVLRGAGEMAFVAGADISEFERNRTSDNVGDYEVDNARAYAALRAIEKPVIAMIHGFCVGGGAALALCADLRYASDDAKFGIPAARLGLGYGSDGIADLVRVVGAAYAQEIFFTADRFDAETALRMGLLNGVHEKAQLEARVLEVATKIAAQRSADAAQREARRTRAPEARGGARHGASAARDRRLLHQR